MIFSRHCDKLHISSCGHSHQVYTATTCFGGESVGYICWWRWTYDCVVMWPLSLIFIFALMGSKDNKFRKQTQLLDNGPEVCSKRSVREVTRLQKNIRITTQDAFTCKCDELHPMTRFHPGTILLLLAYSRYHRMFHLRTNLFLSSFMCDSGGEHARRALSMYCSHFYHVNKKFYINANQGLVNIVFSKQKDASIVLLNHIHKMFLMTLVERSNTFEKYRKGKKLVS